MVIIDPQARFYNTPEQYKKVEDFVNAMNGNVKGFTIDEKEMDKELDKVMNMLDKKLKAVFK